MSPFPFCLCDSDLKLPHVSFDPAPPDGVPVDWLRAAQVSFGNPQLFACLRLRVVLLLYRNMKPRRSLPPFGWPRVGLSASLQSGIRFFDIPLPAHPSLCLAARFLQKGAVYGLTLFLDLRPGGLGSACLPEELCLRIGHLRSPIPVLLPFGQALQRLWLVYDDDIYQQFISFSHTTRA